MKTSWSQVARLQHTCRRLYSAIPDGTIPESKRRFVPESGTYPKGFKVSGTHVGVKASNTRFPDLALLVSDRPAAAAAVFTQNRFKAAPVLVSMANLAGRAGRMRGIVVNAGCANAVTGNKGLNDARAMSEELRKCVDPESQDTSNANLVMSTGVIGQYLPIAKILAGIPQGYQSLADDHDAWLTTARAICTTDTFPKLHSTTFQLPSSPGITYSLAGMTKGAGMIHPNMATLLGIMATDAPIQQRALRSLLKKATQESFNCISVDGDSSTNDTLAIFANGAAGGTLVHEKSVADYDAMATILTEFSQKLSQLVVRDGEGATKFVRVRVRKAFGKGNAKNIASSVARSPLVKTALYGKDANWGRILCAIGYAPHIDDRAISTGRTNVSIGRPEDEGTALKLVVNGEPAGVDEAKAVDLLKNEDLEILIELNTGIHQADYWFCDFSHEYVTINGDYRT